jgi:hypothetical protein
MQAFGGGLMTIEDATNLAIIRFLGEPWCEETKQQLSDTFRKILPGPYEIDWVMEDHTPELKLTFTESPEATEWMLLHR